MRIGDQRSRASIRSKDMAQIGADTIGISRHVGETAGRQQFVPGDRGFVIRTALDRDQQHQRALDQRVQPLQRADFEDLHEYAVIGVVEVGFAQRGGEQVDRVDAFFLQQPSGMLELGVDADRAAGLGLLRAHQRHDLLEGRNLVEPVEPRIGRPQSGQAFPHAQAAQFGEREILGEPAGH